MFNDNIFYGMAIFFVIVGAAIMGICFWLLPWLWHVAKPFLHMVTA